MAGKKRLLWQLYPSFLAVVIISLLAVLWLENTHIRKFYYSRTAADIEERSRLLERQALGYFFPYTPEGLQTFCREIGALGATRVTVILPSGQVVGDSAQDPNLMDNHLDRPEVREALKGQVGVSIRYSLTLNRHMMYVGTPLKNDSRLIGVLRTALPLTDIDQAIRGIQVKIALGALVVALLAALASLYAARRVSRPLEEIRRGVERFALGDFKHRLAVPDLGEIGGLAEAVNNMAVKLQEQINTIQRQRNELETVLTSMVEGVAAVDKEERIISLNRAAADMFETSPAGARGRRIQEIVRNVDFQKFAARALASDTLAEEDIVLYTRDERVLNCLGTRLKDEEGRDLGALIVLNDVTQLRKLENLRQDFVANVSHEIKTPITAIKGFVETLREGAMDSREDTQRFLEIIARHADRLSDIVDDLLNLSRIEQGAEKGAIALEEEYIHPVLAAAIQVCESKAAGKKVNIALSCDKNLKARINSALLEQAVVNLLDNAIKYGDEENEIRIEAAATTEGIIISVKDRGRGIKKEHLGRLFERFYRVDKDRSRKNGGTGLGLSIVKHIAQAHGGSVTVESEWGRGSAFSLRLPAL